MSVFSNGGYVPSGLEFAEWVEYLEARDEAIDYQDFLEAMGLEEDEELDTEEDLKLSISEKEMDAVLKKIETMTKGLSESISAFLKELNLPFWVNCKTRQKQDFFTFTCRRMTHIRQSLFSKLNRILWRKLKNDVRPLQTSTEFLKQKNLMFRTKNLWMH